MKKEKKEKQSEQTLSEKILESLAPLMKQLEESMKTFSSNNDADGIIKIGSLIARIKKDAYTAEAQLRVMANSAIGAQIGIEKIMADRRQSSKEEEMVATILENVGEEKMTSILRKLGSQKKRTDDASD